MRTYNENFEYEDRNYDKELADYAREMLSRQRYEDECRRAQDQMEWEERRERYLADIRYVKMREERKKEFRKDMKRLFVELVFTACVAAVFFGLYFTWVNPFIGIPLVIAGFGGFHTFKYLQKNMNV